MSYSDGKNEALFCCITRDYHEAAKVSPSIDTVARERHVLCFSGQIFYVERCAAACDK